MELTPSKLTWKRASQLIKVGSFTSKDDLQTTKRKCANALNLHSAATPDLHLIVKGAVVDDSAFSTLASFLNALSPQQRSHLCFGIGIKVKLFQISHIMCMYYIQCMFIAPFRKELRNLREALK